MSVRRMMAAGLSRRRALELLRPMVAAVLEDRGRGGARPSPFGDGDAAVLNNLAQACDQSDPADGALYRKALRLALEALEVDDADLHLAAAARGPKAEPVERANSADRAGPTKAPGHQSARPSDSLRPSAASGRRPRN